YTMKYLKYIFCGFVVFLASCANESQDVKDIKAVIERNVDGCRNENLDQVLSTVDDSAKELTRAQCKMIFDAYDLDYDVKIVEVKMIDKDSAEVRLEQTTNKVRGPAFKDNKIKTKNLLKKKNGAWVITSTVVENVEYL
ncbi:MAG: hypothetical protein J6T16_02185, partial [Opitutales bacterium]|nr:hypothetical protein [Opitutales bacterium]